MEDGLAVSGIGHGGDHPADPVKALGGDFAGGAGEVGRGGVHIGIERHHRIEGIGRIGDPLHRAELLRQIRAHLGQRHEAVAVDADRTVGTLALRVAIGGIRVIRSALIVRRQQVFHVFRCDLPLRDHTPGQVVRMRGIVCIGAFPDPGVGVQMPQHEPGTRCVIHMVSIVVAAEGIARVEAAVQREVEVVLVHKGLQVLRAHVVFLCAAGVGKVEAVDAELVGHHDIAVVRHTAGHPVVAADGLQPPDLVHILKRDAVHLIGAVRPEQLAQSHHALAGRADIGQHEADDVLLANAAGHFRPFPFGGLVHHQRVCAQNARVGRDGLGGRHAHMGRIDARGRPDALAFHGVGHGRHPQRMAGQRHLHMGDHRPIDGRVLLRLHDHELFGREMPRTRIVVAGDHGGAIV